jgi:predicted DNA-binding transcriptional regulator
MDKRKGMGVLIFSLCITAFFVYAYLLMLSEWSPIVLQLSVLMAVGGILGIIAWIGYVMATTKPTSATITSSDDSPT